jgi:copper chaperone CopZ
MTHVQLTIEGMHCDGCVARVTSALKSLSGVTVDAVNIGSARVHYEAPLDPATLVQALEKVGFDARADTTPATPAADSNRTR